MRLQNLMTLNTEIQDKKRSIETIKSDLGLLNNKIVELNQQIAQLQAQLDRHKAEYVKSLRYMYRNRSMQSKMMFIFSAKNFTQMYRRTRFLRHYASFQRSQGEAIVQKKQELTLVKAELLSAKDQKDILLKKDITIHQELEASQTEQQKVVTTLQKEHKTIEALIAEQRKKDAELNARIDKLIAEEVARAKARAEAEAKRKAAAEAEKKRKEEMARKKAEAERIERENQRRIAEAKAKEERLKAEARAAERKERKEAERRAKEAERERLAAERKAAEERKAHERELAAVKHETTAAATMDVEDRKLSSNFESNRGRLPMPITGSYQVVNSFGQYDVEGLKNVRLDNKGVNLKGQPGAGVRCVFNGEVVQVFSYSGVTGIIVRHGNYYSVYGNIGSVRVSRGQTVSTGQTLGTVGSEGILQFQLRKGKAPLNPMQWLKR
jgi:septal ring factor EnvC (AmiA/AmiB activator)